MPSTFALDFHLWRPSPLRPPLLPHLLLLPLLLQILSEVTQNVTFLRNVIQFVQNG